MNVEITYCCNCWQMHKNISEIATANKRVWSEVVRNKLFKTLHYWSRDMLNFYFLDKGLGRVFPAHFVYVFSTKMFLILYAINWPNFIAWLSFLLEILGNMCIAIVCYPSCDIMDFEINLIFLIEPFFLYDQKVMTKT